MGKGIRPFCCHQNFVPNGLSVPAWGYIHMVKHEKNVYKIGLWSYFFLNLQQMGKVIRAFCWHQKFVPKGLSALAPAIDIYKINKNVYKIRFLFVNLQWMGKVIRAFCWHQKFVPKGLYALAPGLYTCIKSLKTSDFEEIILKLATYGQREKAFLLSSKVCPQCVVCPCPGLYTCGKTWKNL